MHDPIDLLWGKLGPVCRGGHVEDRWGELLGSVGKVNITLASHYSCRAPLFGNLHSHPAQFHIVHIVSGEGAAEVAGHGYRAVPGDTLVVRPNEPHASIGDSDTTYELIEIKFSFGGPAEWHLVPRVPTRCERYDSTAIVGSMHRLVEARLSDSDSGAWLARLCLVEVLMRLLGESSPLVNSRCPHGEIERKMVQAATYMSRHYGEPLTVKRVADLVNLSESHFSSSFKRTMKVSPIEYLLQRRMQHAVELLRESSLPVERIAEVCGFESSQYFSRFVKQRTGLCPTRLRQAQDR